MSKQITIGMIAHVDAGKTTLSEALLYQTGIIRRLGRVDNGDAFLDSDQLEKKRGITIFSHQAKLEYDDLSITLLDHIIVAGESTYSMLQHGQIDMRQLLGGTGMPPPSLGREEFPRPRTKRKDQSKP